MTRNFLEMCRKDAKWPAIVRDVPQFAKGGNKQTWSMSQDEIANFVAAVRIRSDDAGEELDELQAKYDSVKDENAKIRIILAAFQAGRVTAQKAESLGVEPDHVKLISEAASGAVFDARKVS